MVSSSDSEKVNATNSSPTLNGAGSADPEGFGIVAEGGGGAGLEGGIAADFSALGFIGAGVEGKLGSAGVPITFRTGSGSGPPGCSLELDDCDDAG